jgi:hypothetical protein
MMDRSALRAMGVGMHMGGDFRVEVDRASQRFDKAMLRWIQPQPQFGCTSSTKGDLYAARRHLRKAIAALDMMLLNIDAFEPLDNVSGA